MAEAVSNRLSRIGCPSIRLITSPPARNSPRYIIRTAAALFETASALGTVGLTLGVTPGLGGVSRLILIFLMYFGRVGGLTLIYAVLPDSGAAPAQLPQERVTVG